MVENEFGLAQRTDRSVTAEAMVSRQAQEVQAAMVVAKRFPRDEYQAFMKIQEACKRKTLAESAIYQYPRGGTKVQGPSIRLAEVLAQNWGNIDFGIMELEQKLGESTVMAYAWDLETNTRQTKIFAVKHQRKAKGKVNDLDDPRDVYEMVANQGARRMRACILGIIPGDVTEAAIKACNETLATGHDKPIKERIKEMLKKFDEFKVGKEMVEGYIGYSVDSFNEQDIVKLRGVYNSLKDGLSKREDYFDLKKPGKADPGAASPLDKETVDEVVDEFEKWQQGGKDGAK